MATCPRCRGHLTEHHRCPRRAGRVAAEAAASALAGAIISLLLVGLADPEGRIAHLDVWAVALGATAFVGLWGLVRR